MKRLIFGGLYRLQNIVSADKESASNRVSQTGWQKEILTDSEARTKVNTRWNSGDDSELIFGLVAAPLIFIYACSLLMVLMQVV